MVAPKREPGHRYEIGDEITALVIVKLVPNKARADLDAYMVMPTCGRHQEIYRISHRRLGQRIRDGLTTCKWCTREDAPSIQARKKEPALRPPPPPEPEYQHLPWPPYRPGERLTEGIHYGNHKMTQPWRRD